MPLVLSIEPRFGNNPSENELGMAPDNSAHGIPVGVAWILVALGLLIAFWLYRITPKKRSSHSNEHRRLLWGQQRP